jgi:hypothetical protein
MKEGFYFIHPNYGAKSPDCGWGIVEVNGKSFSWDNWHSSWLCEEFQKQHPECKWVRIQEPTGWLDTPPHQPGWYFWRPDPAAIDWTVGYFNPGMGILIPVVGSFVSWEAMLLAHPFAEVQGPLMPNA